MKVFLDAHPDRRKARHEEQRDELPSALPAAARTQEKDDACGEHEPPEVADPHRARQSVGSYRPSGDGRERLVTSRPQMRLWWETALRCRRG